MQMDVLNSHLDVGTTFFNNTSAYTEIIGILWSTAPSDTLTARQLQCECTENVPKFLNVLVIQLNSPIVLSILKRGTDSVQV